MNKKIKNKTWRKIKLGEVVDIVDGDRGKNYPKKEEFLNNGYCVFLDAKNIFGSEFDFSNVQFISKERDQLLRKGKLERNDFVLTTRGTVGNIAYYGKDIKFDNIRINSGMVILRVKKDIIDENFFNLYLISQEFKNQIKVLKTGSAQPQLPIRDLKLFEIKLPSIAEQKSIVSILWPVKNKIELNNKISAALEQIAQTIFKEWFVKFKFPGHEKAKMVDSKMGRIPEILNFINIVGVLVCDKGFEPGSDNYNLIKKDRYIPFYRVRDIGVQKIETDVYIDKKLAENNICKEKDVLISLDGTVGRVAIGRAGSYSSGIYKVYSNLQYDYIKSSFIYFFLKSDYVQNILTSFTKGTVISHASFALDYIYIPTNPYYIKKFQSIADPIFKTILDNIRENQKLVALRDLLLPKLMSEEMGI